MRMYTVSIVKMVERLGSAQLQQPRLVHSGDNVIQVLNSTQSPSTQSVVCFYCNDMNNISLRSYICAEYI